MQGTSPEGRCARQAATASQCQLESEGLLTLAHPPASLPLWAPWLFGAGVLTTLAGYLVLDSWRSRRL